MRQISNLAVVTESDEILKNLMSVASKLDVELVSFEDASDVPEGFEKVFLDIRNQKIENLVSVQDVVLYGETLDSIKPFMLDRRVTSFLLKASVSKDVVSVFYTIEKTEGVKSFIENEIKEIIESAGIDTVESGKFRYCFGSDKFFYEGREFYLTRKEKYVMARKLLLNEKCGKERYIVCRLRSRLAKSGIILPKESKQV